MRRVPKHVSAFDSRRHIRIALKTKDEKEALRMASVYDGFVEKYWRDLIRSGGGDSGFRQFREAKLLAKAHGFAYKDISEIVSSPLEEVLSRVEAIADNPVNKAPALLGTATHSELPVADCIERFWPLCADRLVGRSEPQKRKYRNPRELAMRDFVEALGTSKVALSELKRSHVLTFVAWLREKVGLGEITGHTANKKIGHVKDVLLTVGKHEEVDVDFKLLFAEVKLAEEVQSRPPFEPSFVQSNLLRVGALSDLNFDARCLVYLMMETGARESEIIGLLPEDIFLSVEIPYIWIRKNGLRSLKTKTSERQIPLVGVSLEAAKQIENVGILRYRDNPYSASAVINKYLKNNELKPTSKHTLYSLRHTFKDRLRDARAPEEVIDELMGHKKAGPKYGRGHMLESKREWLEKIAFEVPELDFRR